MVSNIKRQRIAHHKARIKVYEKKCVFHLKLFSKYYNKIINHKLFISKLGGDPDVI